MKLIAGFCQQTLHMITQDKAKVLNFVLLESTMKSKFLSISEFYFKLYITIISATYYLNLLLEFISITENFLPLNQVSRMITNCGQIADTTTFTLFKYKYSKQQ